MYTHTRLIVLKWEGRGPWKHIYRIICGLPSWRQPLQLRGAWDYGLPWITIFGHSPQAIHHCFSLVTASHVKSLAYHFMSDQDIVIHSCHIFFLTCYLCPLCEPDKNTLRSLISLLSPRTAWYCDITKEKRRLVCDVTQTRRYILWYEYYEVLFIYCSCTCKSVQNWYSLFE